MSVVRLAVLLALTLGAATVADPLQVHRDAVVVDLHVDTLLDLAGGKRTRGGGGGQVDIPRLRQGGVDVQVFAAYIDPGQAPRGKERARELITAFHRAMDRHADAIASARTVEEIAAAGRAGKIAAVLSVENLGDALQGEIEQVDRRHRGGGVVLGASPPAAAAFGTVRAPPRGPIVPTPSDAAAVQPHRRNLTD